MNKHLVILGMHRSGTSLISNWVHACGINIGDLFSADKVGNEEGHFEDTDFLFLHMDILSSNKLDPSGLESFELADTISNEIYSKMKSLINLKDNKNECWGWKEPRTCLFLNYYRELLPDSNYLVLLRDPAIVVDSLIRRDLVVLKMQFKECNYLKYKSFDLFYKWRKNRMLKIKEEIYLKAWIYYNEQIIKHLSIIDQDKVLICSFDKIQMNQQVIFDFFKRFKYSFNEVDFGTIYRSNLIKKEQIVFKYSSADLIKKSYEIYSFLASKSNF